MWSIILASALFYTVASQSTDELPTVTLSQGIVVGSESVRGNYYEFHGIPFADSTSGSHRFKAPSPPPAFQEAFLADRKDIKCVRALGVGYEGVEDCLVVNIFTPSLNETSQLPVMVWVKGREFDQAQEPQLSFTNIVEKDVVVVTLNFRESILGFLCLGTETAPGNAGLKDIIAGLRWVQENIAQFGGNPNSVTLFGHGTGAAAVDLVTLSPLAEGLVHRAIAQSGSSIAPWSVTRNPMQYALLVAEALGHTVADNNELSDVFTRTSVSALMAVINDLELTDNSLAFAPCIENENLDGDEKFLIASPYQTIIDGNFIQIPIILGYVENEGTIRAEKATEDDWLERMDGSFVDFIQPDLKFETIEEEQNVASEVRQFYFNGREINIENVADYISYHGDTMIIISAMREARLRASHAIAPTYLYQFSYQGALGEPFIGPLRIEGAAHSEELAYLFTSDVTTDPGSWDILVSEMIIDRWTNFAKSGVPTSSISATTWNPVTAESTNVLLFRNDEEPIGDETTNLEVQIVNPKLEVFTFWSELYAEYFADAVGIWEPNIRDDDDEIVVVTDSPTNVNTVAPDEEDAVEDASATEEAENDPDSASTAVGYTFSILTLFALLNKFHLAQVIS